MLHIYVCRNFVLSTLTSLLLFCLSALRRGSTARTWVCPIFDGTSAAREESIFRNVPRRHVPSWPWAACDAQPLPRLIPAREQWPIVVLSPRPSHGGRSLDFVGVAKKSRRQWAPRRRCVRQRPSLPSLQRPVLNAFRVRRAGRGIDLRGKGAGAREK